ncbi:hypothetical protein F4780DRAFT_447680 [Xylariomycetidae sp. FL0641]|nr:hypothetical protein F4780DRAFT_447680 [Xylariomycetidae sp. FL0641]
MSKDLAYSVANYFRHIPWFRYVGPLQNGRHGGTLLFNEETDSGELMRRLVVKYSLDPEEDEMLYNEADALEMLRGAEHIGQLVAIGYNRWVEVPTPKPGERTTPYFVLEFIPNGTAMMLLEKLRDSPENNVEGIPNRVLWSILLCLVRTCIAMAYPPNGPINGPVHRETYDPDKEPINLTQNSSHLRNIMFADPKPDPEHHGYPLVKLIDFGRARIEGPETMKEFRYFQPDIGTKMNFWATGQIMQQLCLPHWPEEELDEALEGDTTYEWTGPDGETHAVLTDAHAALRDSEWLDPELRMLLVRMLSNKLHDIPELAEVLEQCERAVATKTADAYADLPRGLGAFETDAYIQDWWQRYLLEPSPWNDWNVRPPKFGPNVPAPLGPAAGLRPLPGGLLGAMSQFLGLGFRDPVVQPQKKPPFPPDRVGPIPNPLPPLPGSLINAPPQIHRIGFRSGIKGLPRGTEEMDVD